MVFSLLYFTNKVYSRLEPPAFGLLFKCDKSELSARPVQFAKVAHIIRKGLDEAFVWYPIAPSGYVSLGCVITRTNELPNKELFCCPRMDLVKQTNISDSPISRSSSSKEPNCWSIWKVENQVLASNNRFFYPSSHQPDGF